MFSTPLIRSILLFKRGCGIFHYVNVLDKIIKYVCSTGKILFYPIFCTYIDTYCVYNRKNCFVFLQNKIRFAYNNIENRIRNRRLKNENIKNNNRYVNRLDYILLYSISNRGTSCFNTS